MMHFRLNDRTLHLENPAGLLLDAVREQHCSSVKPVCREGDCGACQILLGRKDSDGNLHYQTFNSCLLPLADVAGCHVITTEGLSGNSTTATPETLTPVQRALFDAGAIQCGYCIPGFVIAMTGWLLNSETPSEEDAREWLSGNLCRCTGYSGFHRAITRLMEDCPPLLPNETPLQRGVRWGLIPARFYEHDSHLAAAAEAPTFFATDNVRYGGGTDLAVATPTLWHDAGKLPVHFGVREGIHPVGNTLHIEAGTRVQALKDSSLVATHFPGLCKALESFASRPVRHQATVAGNLAHASPAGDLCVMLLALEAQLDCEDAEKKRSIALQDFFLGPGRTALKADEQISRIVIPLSEHPTQYFHFEKMSKRPQQDIASASMAINLELKNNVIGRICIAAGGVAATPLRLPDAEKALTGVTLDAADLVNRCAVAAQSLTPIDDVRGSAGYKRALVPRLLRACLENIHTQTGTTDGELP